MSHYHDSEDLKALGEFKKLAPAEFQGFVELDAIVRSGTSATVARASPRSRCHREAVGPAGVSVGLSVVLQVRPDWARAFTPSRTGSSPGTRPCGSAATIGPRRAPALLPARGPLGHTGNHEVIRDRLA
jgi:hypothetical protein